MNKINNKCRTCFNESTKGLQSLTKKTSTDENNQQKSYAELLNEVANINIMQDKCSKMPQAICGLCSKKLKAAHAFVQQAQEVNEKLYSMFLQNPQSVDSVGVGKSSDCLQEVQIDIAACAEIKMEHDDVGDSSDGVVGVDVMMAEPELKQENAEEDALAVNFTKSEDNFEEGNDLKDSLDVTYPNVSLTILTSDTEDNIPNILEQTMDTSDNNSNINERSCHSASDDNDDNEWLNESNNSTKKSLKKKTSPTKKRKKSPKAEETKDKNEDEWLQVKCNDCDKIFDNSRLLNRHLRLNHVPDELKIQCLHCEAKFSRRHNMYAHMRRIHKTENLEEFQIQPKKSNAAKQYACQQCTRSYTNKYKLIAHVNSHHNPDNKTTAPKEKVLQPKKRFLCTLCGLKFDSEGNLNIHFRRHTGEKPYKCEFCDRAYPRLYDVQVHRRTHTGEKPYQCTLCEKTFRRSNKLKIHMRTHTNERPYKCTQCEKAFKQSKDLNIHKRTHTGERPYKCAVCQSTFTQSNSLRLHQIKQQHLEKVKPVEDLPTTMTFMCQQPT
ncbi:zinc finger protein 235-like [Lucilia sericata]|uniref:zinc finger protein 235-like n=1 Tax=Lucilia sericata TaxID=13632 RepID=UPI0018A82F82|nr:zinc finger protein 235-like [Lucilia sericata]